jgi:hypothetical protein
MVLLRVSKILQSRTFHCVWLFFLPLSTISMFVYFLDLNCIWLSKPRQLPFKSFPRVSQIIRSCTSPGVRPHISWYTFKISSYSEYLKFYNLAHFTVFDSFSYPFLPYQCSFTFCILFNENLPPFVPENVKCGWINFYWYLLLLKTMGYHVHLNKTMRYHVHLSKTMGYHAHLSKTMFTWVR